MRPKVKVCGVTDPDFAAEAARRGVDYLGVIFAAKSPRKVDGAKARQIAAAIPNARYIRASGESIEVYTQWKED